jgi:nucleoside-diphosphate-sugar epimerase
MSFYNSFDLPVSVVRPFNTYGPRQSARAVIPSIIIQIANGEKKIKLGDTSPTRDFNYVTDTCNGFIKLANSEEAVGQVVNIGSNEEISILDTFNLIKELMKSDVELVLDEQRIRPSSSEVFRLWCDNSKINELTGFVPAVSIEEGLTRTISWLNEPLNFNKYKSEIYNV